MKIKGLSLKRWRWALGCNCIRRGKWKPTWLFLTDRAHRTNILQMARLLGDRTFVEMKGTLCLWEMIPSHGTIYKESIRAMAQDLIRDRFDALYSGEKPPLLPPIKVAWDATRLTWRIIDGHHRYDAYFRAGWEFINQTKVPVIFLIERADLLYEKKSDPVGPAPATHCRCREYCNCEKET